MTDPMNAYLGDGVYASFDGFGIVLDLRAQPPTLPITKITLEPTVFSNLVDYEKQVRKAVEAEAEKIAEAKRIDDEAKKIDDAYEHHIQHPEQHP